MRRTSAASVSTVFSAQRMAPYLRQCGGEQEKALELYSWSAQMSSALFELIAHLEVAVRNSIDRALSSKFDDEVVGIPGFLRRPPMTAEAIDQIEYVREKLRATGRESRHQVIANLSFGFWSGLLGADYEDLWRSSLHHAFPLSDGLRKTVGPALESIRKLRNRVAHHVSVLDVDVPFERDRILQIASYISQDLRAWLDDYDRCVEIYESRPYSEIDTLVVSGASTWNLYEDCSAFLCQPGRTFRAVQRMAFYADQEIKKEFPRIVTRRDNVEWTESAADKLEYSDSREDRKIATLIRQSRQRGWTDGRYQVFLLTAPGGNPEHRSRLTAIPHERRGRGTAFVRNQRYVSLHSLQTYTTTEQYYND